MIVFSETANVASGRGKTWFKISHVKMAKSDFFRHEISTTPIQMLTFSDVVERVKTRRMSHGGMSGDVCGLRDISKRTHGGSGRGPRRAHLSMLNFFVLAIRLDPIALASSKSLSASTKKTQARIRSIVAKLFEKPCRKFRVFSTPISTPKNQTFPHSIFSPQRNGSSCFMDR